MEMLRYSRSGILDVAGLADRVADTARGLQFSLEHGTAYHEAGHAVAAVLRNIPFGYVTIVPRDSDDSLGHISTRGKDSRPAEDVIVYVLAGPVAAALAVGLGEDRLFVVGADERTYHRAFGRIPKAKQKTDKQYKNEAKKFCHTHWGAIEAVARALEARKTLQAAEVESIVFANLLTQSPGIPGTRARGNSSRIGVDRGNNVLRGYVVAEAGTFADGRGSFDGEALRAIVKLINAQQPLGIRSRFTHPYDGEELGLHLGRVRNAWFDGGLVRADLTFNPAASISPKGGNLTEYVMTLAETDSAAISSSLVLYADRIEQPRRKGSYEDLPAKWLPTQIAASDIVGQGAAVQGPLLSRPSPYSAEAMREVQRARDYVTRQQIEMYLSEK